MLPDMSTLEGSHLSTPSYSATRVVHLQQLLKAESPNTMGKNWSPSTNKASVLEQRTFLGLWRGSGGDTERKKERKPSFFSMYNHIYSMWHETHFYLMIYGFNKCAEILLVPKIWSAESNCAENTMCRNSGVPASSNPTIMSLLYFSPLLYQHFSSV